MGEGLGPAERNRRLQSLLREERIQTLVLACPAQRAAEMTQVADACRPLGLDLFFFTEFTPWLREGDRLDALGSLSMIRSAPLPSAVQNPTLRRIAEWFLALLILPFALLGVGLGWFSLLLSGRGPRWEGEVWDNGRAERVPVPKLSPARGYASRLDRTGISRGLAVFWILTGRLRLVGAPPRPWGGPAADSMLSRLPVGITGEWFTDPSLVGSLAEVERSVRRSDLNTDLRVLVRSVARIAELLIHSSNSQESQGARS
jgi:hypothetical protein